MKIQKQIVCLLLCCTISFSAKAQFNTPVLPDLEGQPLLNELVNQYKPSTVYSYGQARDTMFSKVYMENDSLSCVYSGHTIYLDPNQDPTTAAFQNGSNNGINTEHTYPQAFGAGSGNPRSDMHHLFPTKTPVNAARGNLPFGDVPDDQTIEWFYLDQTQNNIPSQNIDAYSERGVSSFEPPENFKGNIARAMFYFYTMYKAEADAQNPNFFESQKETLFQWHLDDPVDQKEWDQNMIIASYQGDKVNPFILDCSLAERSYGAGFNGSCQTSSLEEQGENKYFELYQNFPNPFPVTTTISYNLTKSFEVNLRVFDARGKLCKTIVIGRQQEGVHFIELDRAVFNSGSLYICQLEFFDGTNYYSTNQKLLKL
ncbi:MAG: endonuclease [Saprospiraceae bacterium]